MKVVAVVTTLSAVTLAAAQAPLWGQCGGSNWTGATTCVVGAICTKQNDFYSQCIPSTATTTPASTLEPTSSTAAPTSTAAPPSGTPVSGFVKTSGQKFTVGGQEFTAAGTNAYWLAQESDTDITKAFSDIAAAGLTVVRTWGFNDVTAVQNYGAYYQLWQNGKATFNTGANGISRFDAVVAAAKAHGIRLIVALTNNWSDYGGMDVYVSQLNPGGTHDTFYTNENVVAAFQAYIKNFVSRYVDEPTIMAWELANEPRCSGSTGSASSACDTTGATINKWAVTISAYIKSIDSNHLVALGDEGWFQEANPPTYPYAPGVGVDFVENLQISTLDFGTFHSYPESWGQSANETLWGVQWITDHAVAQRAANKPVVLEEFGVTTGQVSTYQQWYSAILNSGLTGDLIWQAGSQLSTGDTPDDGFAVYPTGTVYPVVKSAAAALKQRG